MGDLSGEPKILDVNLADGINPSNVAAVTVDGKVLTEATVMNWIDADFTLVNGSVTRDINGDLYTIDLTDGVRTKRITITRDVNGDIQSWSEVLL